jgi:hypothetical protein
MRADCDGSLRFATDKRASRQIQRVRDGSKYNATDALELRWIVLHRDGCGEIATDLGQLAQEKGRLEEELRRSYRATLLDARAADKRFLPAGEILFRVQPAPPK